MSRRHASRRERGLLRDAPAFRALWLSRSVSFTGDGVARVALVLLVAGHGPDAVGLVLLVNTAPRLLGPVAGTVADRMDQRALLAGAELGQGAVYAVLAVLTPPLPVLLPLVAVSGLLATLVGPAGKSSVPRLVAAERLPAANALLGVAFNLQVLAGPALGGALAGIAGTSTAFAVNAGSFAASALLLRRLPPLPAADGGAATGLFAETVAGLRYAAHAAVPRALAVGTLLLVSFAALDNVALVFLVKNDLHGSGTEYGAAVAGFGAGMIVASLALTRIGRRRRPQHWLLLGVIAGSVGTAVTGVAPLLAVAVLGQVLAGAGNSADVIANDTLVQQLVPRQWLGRVFGAVGTSAQAGSAIAYAAAGPLVGLTGARVTLFVAAAGALVGLAALTPVLRRPDERAGALAVTASSAAP